VVIPGRDREDRPGTLDGLTAIFLHFFYIIFKCHFVINVNLTPLDEQTTPKRIKK
jgi:hypothetical protein